MTTMNDDAFIYTALTAEAIARARELPFEEVAARLKISTDDVKRLVRRGKLESKKNKKGRLYIHETTLSDYIRHNY